jgi:hypothetical protein
MVAKLISDPYNNGVSPNEIVNEDMLYIIRHARWLATNQGLITCHFNVSCSVSPATSSDLDAVSLLASLKSFQHRIEGFISFSDLLRACEHSEATDLWPDIASACFIVAQDILNLRKKGTKKHAEAHYEQSLVERSSTAADCLSGLFRLLSDHFCSQYYIRSTSKFSSTITIDSGKAVSSFHQLGNMLLREQREKSRALMTHPDVVFSLKCIAFIREFCLAFLFENRLSPHLYIDFRADVATWLVPLVLEQLESTRIFDRKVNLVALLRVIVQLDACQVNSSLQDLLTDQEYHRFLRRLFENLSSENFRLVVDSLYIMVWLSLGKTVIKLESNASIGSSVMRTGKHVEGLASSRSSPSSCSSNSLTSTLSCSLGLSMDMASSEPDSILATNNEPCFANNDVCSKHQRATRILFAKQNLKPTFQLILNLVSKGGDSYVICASCDLLERLLLQCHEITTQWLETSPFDSIQDFYTDLLGLLLVSDDVNNIRALLSLFLRSLEHCTLRALILIAAERHSKPLANALVRCLLENDLCLPRLTVDILCMLHHVVNESPNSSKFEWIPLCLNDLVEQLVTNCIDKTHLGFKCRQLQSSLEIRAPTLDEQQDPLRENSCRGNEMKDDADKADFNNMENAAHAINACRYLLESESMSSYIASALIPKWTTSYETLDWNALFESIIGSEFSVSSLSDSIDWYLFQFLLSIWVLLGRCRLVIKIQIAWQFPHLEDDLLARLFFKCLDVLSHEVVPKKQNDEPMPRGSTLFSCWFAYDLVWFVSHLSLFSDHVTPLLIKTMIYEAGVRQERLAYERFACWEPKASMTKEIVPRSGSISKDGLDQKMRIQEENLLLRHRLNELLVGVEDGQRQQILAEKEAERWRKASQITIRENQSLNQSLSQLSSELAKKDSILSQTIKLQGTLQQRLISLEEHYRQMQGKLLSYTKVSQLIHTLSSSIEGVSPKEEETAQLVSLNVDELLKSLAIK